MRTIFLVSVCALVLALSAYLAGKPDEETPKVRIRLVDADTGKDVAGIVRVFARGKDDTLPLPGLFDRTRGLKPAKEARGWHVVPVKGVQTTLPRERLVVEAVSGLETALARKEVDLSDKSATEIVVELPFLFRPETGKLVAGNTHRHP